MTFVFRFPPGVLEKNAAVGEWSAIGPVKLSDDCESGIESCKATAMGFPGERTLLVSSRSIREKASRKVWGIAGASMALGSAVSRSSRSPHSYLQRSM